MTTCLRLSMYEDATSSPRPYHNHTSLFFTLLIAKLIVFLHNDTASISSSSSQIFSSSGESIPFPSASRLSSRTAATRPRNQIYRVTDGWLFFFLFLERRFRARFFRLKLLPPPLHRHHPGFSAIPTFYYTMNTFLSWIRMSLSMPIRSIFVLPKSKLQHRLTSSDMAALAVKASLALQNSSNKDPRRGKKARISSVLSVNPDHQEHKAVKISFDRKPKPQVQQRAAS
ncbi:POLY polymerase [Salix viminalis]|uniref:POLY polymerase n=1 Tax=Salix viminalis TaxID=40686 RepID=A0A9Q0ZJG9_SALVM|nr:POLY polymerase [Salix viminalis]